MQIVATLAPPTQTAPRYNLKSPELRAAILRKTEGRCWYCGCTIRSYDEVRPDSYTIDHIIPRGVAGDAWDNLVPACWSCNASKGRKSLEHYRLYVGRIRAGMPAFTEAQRRWLADRGFVLTAPPRATFYGETL
jgi:5-methylcytosine-specific restriction endonuclease McrA